VAEKRDTPRGMARYPLAVRVAGLLAALSAAILGLYLLSAPQPPAPRDSPWGSRERSTGSPSGEPTPAPLTAPTSQKPPDTRITQGLVGARSCRECHPGESAQYSRSGHARTLRPGALSAIAGWLDGRTVKDPEIPDVTWTYALADGRLEVERSDHGKFHCFPLDYAVGSGTNGVTFMTVRPDASGESGATGIEHRFSYYAKGPKLDITPGQSKDDSVSQQNKVGPHGRPLDVRQLEKCLNCHATVTSTAGPGRTDPESLVANVSCERCHGPGRAHVEAARSGAAADDLKMPLGSGDASPLRQVEVCGQCHRRLDNVSPSLISKENSEIVRFQPVGLALSRCFQGGESGLSCTSCHDPHARVSRDRASYESVCLKCHSPAHRKSCPVSASTGCVNCHMPRRTVSVEFQFTDHWIRVPESDKSTAAR
jgi:hypothetical protein